MKYCQAASYPVALKAVSLKPGDTTIENITGNSISDKSSFTVVEDVYRGIVKNVNKIII